MNVSFWSDENRWFVPRAFGLGYSLNLKYVAKRLGLIERGAAAAAGDATPIRSEDLHQETREERLLRQIEASRFEERQ